MPGAIPPSLFCSVHIAYYLWYGAPYQELDADTGDIIANKTTYSHWNHEVIPHWN